MLVAEKVLPNWVGHQFRHCEVGILSDLQAEKRNGLYRHRTGPSTATSSGARNTRTWSSRRAGVLLHRAVVSAPACNAVSSAQSIDPANVDRVITLEEAMGQTDGTKLLQFEKPIVGAG